MKKLGNKFYGIVAVLWAVSTGIQLANQNWGLAALNGTIVLMYTVMSCRSEDTER